MKVSLFDESYYWLTWLFRTEGCGVAWHSSPTWCALSSLSWKRLNTPHDTVFLLPVLKINMCRLVWNNLPYFLVTVMKGVVRSAPCAAVRLAAQSRRDETLRSIRRAERLVLQSNAQSLDSAARYRASPFSSRLPDLTILGHGMNEKQRDDEMKTRPKSTGTMVRLLVHMRLYL